MADSDFEKLLAYAAVFYANMGNYLSFGDSKIVPDLASDSFESILKVSSVYESLSSLWEQVKGPLYSLDQQVWRQR